MEAIREIVDIHNNQLSIRIPDTFNYDRVEVLIFPLPIERGRSTSTLKSSRGALRKYANEALVSKEESAWSDVMEEKYENSGC